MYSAGQEVYWWGSLQRWQVDHRAGSPPAKGKCNLSLPGTFIEWQINRPLVHDAGQDRKEVRCAASLHCCRAFSATTVALTGSPGHITAHAE